ncbi:MAG: YaiI/YqxD family protein, partial [Gammaproteobacteria bacterium]
MKIYVDADACPVAIKEILFRAADRTATNTILVANNYLRTPTSKYVKFKQVDKG